MPEAAAMTARTTLGMQIPQRGRERHMLDSGDVAARVVTHLFDVDTLLETAPLGMLDSGAARPNVLIQCAASDMPGLVRRLEAIAVQPVHTWVVSGTSQWPDMPTGTLVIHDVAVMTVAQQIELFDWMTRRAGTTQVIALTTQPLAPLVEGGHFLQALYCRINVLQATAKTRPAV